MYFFYGFLMTLYGMGLVVVLYARAWRRRRSPEGIRERLGHLSETLRSNGQPTIWFHSCSVGETLSVLPLAHALRERFPEARLVFSTTTHSGQAIARERFAKFGNGNTFYFPIDTATISRRVLDWIRPAVFVIIDTEIWPNITHQAFQRGIPVILVNGRISADSFRLYRWIRPVLRRVFQNYQVLLMSSEEDAHRVLQLGAPADRVVAFGNIKYDRNLVEQEVNEAQARALRESFGFEHDGGELIVAGSTHPGEEQILFEVLRRLRATPRLEQTRLLVAPRHPDRFDAVADLAARYGFAVRRRSSGATETGAADVLLLDTIGELATAYRFAAVAFVGGTLVRHGGHSIMEPAVYAKPIVIGPSIENFPQIFRELQSRHGIRQIRSGEEDKTGQIEQLTETIARLLLSPQEREAQGKAAYSVFEENRGTAQRTVERIAALYEAAIAREAEKRRP